MRPHGRKIHEKEGRRRSLLIGVALFQLLAIDTG
jgi:hypothetical protein